MTSGAICIAAVFPAAFIDCTKLLNLIYVISISTVEVQTST